MVKLTRSLEEAVARLTDDELLCELQCAERCALLATRTLREMALLRVRCVRRELADRAVRVDKVIGSDPR
jgi:hypothetical protein